MRKLTGVMGAVCGEASCSRRSRMEGIPDLQWLTEKVVGKLG